MCIFQKSYALLGQTFSKFKMRGSFTGPTFFGTFLCQEYGKNSAAIQKKMCFLQIDKSDFKMSEILDFMRFVSWKIIRAPMQINP